MWKTIVGLLIVAATVPGVFILTRAFVVGERLFDSELKQAVALTACIVLALAGAAIVGRVYRRRKRPEEIDDR